MYFTIFKYCNLILRFIVIFAYSKKYSTVSLSDFYYSSIIAILGGFKGRSHATVDLVYFLYAFNVKTINILLKSQIIVSGIKKIAILK